MKKNFTKQDFYDLLTPNGDCLEWSKSVDSYGYGHTWVYGTLVLCHRLALQLEGIDTTDKVVLHSCDNPKCCNPAHLRLGTLAENMIDMTEKRRHPKPKLADSDVIQIRNMIFSGIKLTRIAEQYNVSVGAISLIKSNKTWSHIK